MVGSTSAPGIKGTPWGDTRCGHSIRSKRRIKPAPTVYRSVSFVRILAETKHQFVAAITDKISAAEVGARFVEFNLFPIVFIEGFDGEIIGRADGGPDYAFRSQGFLQFGSRNPQFGNVDGVDRVDAVLDKCRFTPANHLLTNADLKGHPRDFTIDPEITIEQINIAAHRTLGIRVQMSPFSIFMIVFIIIKGRTPNKGAIPAGINIEIGGHLDGIADETLVVVQVPVIVVARVLVAPVGDPDYIIIPTLDPPLQAVGNG